MVRMLIRKKVWPYCNVAKQMLATVMADNEEPGWSGVEWLRHLEILKDYPSSSSIFDS